MKLEQMMIFIIFNEVKKQTLVNLNCKVKK